MTIRAALGLAHLGLWAVLGLAQAADNAAQTARETRPVDARVVRVHLEGVVPCASARARPA